MMFDVFILFFFFLTLLKYRKSAVIYGEEKQAGVRKHLKYTSVNLLIVHAVD